MSVKGMFSRGYNAVEEEEDRREEERKKRGNRIYRFFISSPKKKSQPSEAQIRFMTGNPINFYQHVVKNRDGGFDNITCSQDKNCPYCAKGDRPQFASAYLVIDRREYENRDGETVSDQARLFVYGTRITSQLSRLDNKYAKKGGLTSLELTMVRSGSSQSTTYTFEVDDDWELTEDDILDALPEHFHEMYDGTEESLEEIIKEQILMDLPSDDSDIEDYDEEESNRRGSRRESSNRSRGRDRSSNRRSNRDDDDDIESNTISYGRGRRNNREEDDDDSDYTPPKRTISKGNKLNKSPLNKGESNKVKSKLKFRK